MIKYICGDILDSNEDMIIHGCNNQRLIGAGIALQIKNKHPEAVERYLKSNPKSSIYIGNVLFDKTNNGKVIANAITQDFKPDDDGCCLKYEKIMQWCKCINNYCEVFDIKIVSMPKIGAGIAGADWGKVCYYIGKYLEPDVNVYIFPE